jgi:hypothetical protein
MDVARRYDLEIQENIVRNDSRGMVHEICEAYEYCYEVVHTLNLAVNAVFCSTDGDDQGFTVAPDYNFGTDQSPDLVNIDPDVYSIALEVIRRQSWVGEYVIGGRKLEKSLKQSLGLGDSFLELGLEREGIGRNDWVVSRTMFLPPFEMFRLEDDHGNLKGFEQRSQLDDPDAIFFPPWKICHLRYNQSALYGQSAWKSSIATGIWAKLKESTNNLANACRDLGFNPNIHEFPENTNRDNRDSYIKSSEAAKQSGMAPTDLYPLPGMKISKLSSQNPNLQTLIDIMVEWRYRMMLPGLPLYFFAGVMNGSARELSAQPAFQHARLRNEWCGMLAQIIHQVIDTEIKLKKGEDFWREKGRFYRIVWPKWELGQDGNGAQQDDMSAAGANNKKSGSENGSSTTTPRKPTSSGSSDSQDYRRLVSSGSFIANGNNHGSRY